MRPCSFVCIVLFAFMIVDQFYSGYHPERLVVAGVVLLAVLTEYGRIIRRWGTRLWKTWRIQ